MIDKLEVGVKYKLVDKVGYLTSCSVNGGLLRSHLTDDGCFVLDYIDEDGDGFINGTVVIGLGVGEGKYFSKFESQMEYRVIRRANGHQVCDWRKGVALYEDEFGTLVRNDKRTKFYTDIVEWREVEEACNAAPSNDIESIIKSLSQEQLSDLIIRAVDMAGLSLPKGNKR